MSTLLDQGDDSELIPASKEQIDTPEQELLGLLKQVGLLNKEPTGPLWRPWVMGPLE